MNGREVGALKRTIGQTVRLFRVSAGLRQKVLAQRLGITPNYLSLVENDRKQPGKKLVLKIAEEFGIPASHLSWYAEKSSGLSEEQERVSQIVDEIFEQLQTLRIITGIE